jgi:hypothetical protein
VTTSSPATEYHWGITGATNFQGTWDNSNSPTWTGTYYTLPGSGFGAVSMEACGVDQGQKLCSDQRTSVTVTQGNASSPAGAPLASVDLGCPASVTAGQQYTCTPKFDVDASGAGFQWNSGTSRGTQPAFTDTAPNDGRASIYVGLFVEFPDHSQTQGEATIQVTGP